MNTKINNDEEWEQFYYYSPQYKPRAYPKQYPCFAKRETCGVGSMGEFEAHYVVYKPDMDVSLEVSFLMGLNAEWEYIC